MPIAPAPRIYTVEEVAEVFGVVPETIRKRLRDGTIKGMKIPAPNRDRARWRISQAELERLQAGE